MIYLILQASYKQTVNTTSSCDKEVVAQAKVIEKEVGTPQILSDRLGVMKFSMQYLQNWLTSDPVMMVFSTHLLTLQL